MGETVQVSITSLLFLGKAPAQPLPWWKVLGNGEGISLGPNKSSLGVSSGSSDTPVRRESDGRMAALLAAGEQAASSLLASIITGVYLPC